MYNPLIFTTMKKMLVLSLMLSAMAMGSAMANDVNGTEERGPRKVNITINVPPGHNPFVCAPMPHDRVCRECPPGRGHNSVARPHRPAPKHGHPHHKFEHGKPHNHPPKGGGAPGKGHNPRPHYNGHRK